MRTNLLTKKTGQGLGFRLAAVAWTIALCGCAPTAPLSANTGHGAQEARLSGNLDPALAYRMRLDFSATANDQACKFDDHITGMWAPRTHSRHFEPDLAGDTHAVRVVLSPTDTQACGWNPTALFVCIGERGAATPPSNCMPLFLIRPGGAPAMAAQLRCRLSPLACTGPDGGNPVQHVSGLQSKISLDIDAVRPG